VLVQFVCKQISLEGLRLNPQRHCHAERPQAAAI
jgi:hypothetical protein